MVSTSSTSPSIEISRGPTIEVDGKTVLLGSRCGSCGTHEFPSQTACARCGAQMDAMPLPAIGTIWSWTVQRTRPKRLKESIFEPFVVAYVDLGPLKVEARLAGHPITEWCIGQSVHLVTPTIDDSPVPYWFEPGGAS